MKNSFLSSLRMACGLLLGLLAPVLAPAQTTPAWQSALALTQTSVGGTARIQATAVDKTTGAVFVTGNFNGQVAFGSTVLTSAGGLDAFVARYNPGTATWAWAKSGGGANNEFGQGIAADGQGGVYATGYFDTSANFGGQPALGGTGQEVFVVAYEASTGAERWAKSGGGAAADQGNGIAADGLGGVFVTGFFTTSATFGGQPALTGTNYEVFVAAYEAGTGAGRWAKSGGNGAAASNEVGTGIAADGLGGVFVTGLFQGGSATFGGQPALTGTSTEVFVAAYEGSNGAGRWAKSGGGFGPDEGYGIAADGLGGVYVTGFFQSSSAVFGGQPALTGSGSEVFVAAYEGSNGAGRWAKSGGNGAAAGADIAYGVAADGLGGVYVTGFFTTSATFAGQALTGTGQEAFVAAYAAADGAGRWAKSGGGAGQDRGYGIAAGSGGVYAGLAGGTPAATFGTTPVQANAPALGTLSRSTGAWQAVATCLTVGGTAQIKATAVDKASGAVFVTGTYTGQVGVGSTVLTSAGGNDAFVARYNPGTATWAWATSGGGTTGDEGRGIAADGLGGVYVTGYFGGGSATFGGQPALTGSGSEVFVAAYAASDGSGRWATSGGGTGGDAGQGIAADGLGGVYVTGFFQSVSATFGGQPALSGSVSSTEVFVAAYAAGDGAGRWAKSGGGSGGDQGLGVAADGLGGVYVTGLFASNGTFGGQSLTGNFQDMFVAAYAASDGAGRWAKNGGGSGSDAGFGIAADGLGGVYVTGQFITSGTFAGQPALAGTSGEVFVVAYEAANGNGRWAKSGGGSGSDIGYGIAADGLGGVYVTGYFNNGSATFAGQPALTGTNNEVFVAAYAAGDGAGRWAKSGGGTATDAGLGIATDGSRLYVGGYVGLPATFGTTTLPGSSSQAGVLAGLGLPPSLLGLSAGTGVAGGSLGATGGALGGLTAVTFTPVGGGAPTNAASGYTSTTGTASGITVPAGLAVGPYTVTVTTTNGTSNSLPFAVTRAAATVSSFAPASGLAGTPVVIQGTGLDRVTGVRFGTGNTTARFTAQSATSLTVLVPVASSTGLLTLTSNDGATGSSATAFTYVARQNLVAALSPAAPQDVCQPRTLTATASIPAFATGTGFNNIAFSLEAQANGQVLAGGSFTTYNGAAANRLVRLNADGSPDASFAVGAGFAGGTSGVVRAVAVQANGKLLVGGDFGTYQGNTANCLLRLNADGSPDASFATGTGFGGLLGTSVYSLAVQADGKVVVGGYFSLYQGVSARHLIRLNADGSRDASFVSGTGFDNAVNSIALQADGKVLAVGAFTTYQGSAANRLLRLNADGSRDATFTTGTNLNNSLLSLALQADGRILVGGSFSSYNSATSLGGIMRLDTNGSRDAAFATGTGFNSFVRSMVVQPDGKVLVGGDFGTYQGSAALRLLRLNADGSRDATFAIGTGFDNNVVSVALQADGKVLVGGNYSAYNGTTGQNRLARLTATGGLNNAATAVAGASFAFSPGNTTTNPLVTSTKGIYSATASLSGETSAASNAVVLVGCAAVSGFAPASGLAGTPVTITGTDLDAVTGVRFGTGGLTTNFVSQSATSLVVLVPVTSSTGLITLTNGAGTTASTATAFAYVVRRNLVAALSPAGSQDVCQPRTLTATASSPALATGTGFTGTVRSVAVQADGKVLVGGSFAAYQGASAKYFIRLNPDGSRDANFNAGGAGFDFNSSILSVAVQVDGKLLVGGFFNNYNNTAGLNGLLRLNADGSRDATFATGTGIGGTVNSVVVQADGKVLVGGSFTSYNGTTGLNHLLRLNADGSRDASFATGAGFNSVVNSVAVQADGKVLVGGDFTSYNGTTGQNALVRLNPDGSLDATFATGAGFSNRVRSVAVQADDKLLLGGDFTTYQGAAAGRIIRLNADGSRDATFNTGGAGFDNLVLSVVVQADGKVLAAGAFTSYSGTANQVRSIRLNADGTRDTGFDTGTGFGSTVYAVAVQPDGQVLAGGQYTTYNSTTTGSLVRLNADGSRNTAATAVPGASFTFSPGNTTTNPLVTSAAGSYTATASLNGETSAASNAVVLTACPPPTIGSFTPASGPAGTPVTITGTNLDRVTGVRFGTGTLTTNFVSQSATSLTVLVPVTSSTGLITLTDYLGSSASSAPNFTYVPRQNLTATLSPAGPLDVCAARTLTAAAVRPAFATGTGFGGNVRSVVAQADGKVLVGGDFLTYNGTTGQRLVRLNADGSLDAGFATGTGFDNYVQTVAVQADGKVLVGGEFTGYNGTTGLNRLVRLNADGSRDAGFVTGTGFNTVVESVVVQADGKVLVGGTFTSYQGTTANRLVRLNADGSRDATFSTGTGFDNPVYSVALQADGKVLVGGFFTSYNGTTGLNYLMRLNADGSLDASFVTGTGFNEYVTSVAVQANGKVLVGGLFTSYNGTTGLNRLVRLNADGSLDAGFATGTGFDAGVSSVAVQADGKVLAGGNLTTYQGTPANRLIRLNADGSRDAGFAIGTGFGSRVRSVAVQADGKVLAGGDFFAYQGTTAGRLVRLNADGSLNTTATAVSGASFTFSPGNTTTNPLVTSTAGNYTATASLNGEPSAASNTVVLSACPIISSFTPASGPAGTSVTITGTDLDRVTGVRFGTGSLTTNFVSQSATSLTVLVPVISSTGRITLTNSLGSSVSSATDFTYVPRRNLTATLSPAGPLDVCAARTLTAAASSPAFATGTGFGVNNIGTVVRSVMPQASGKVLVGGQFTSYNGTTNQNRLIRLNADGSPDAGFATGTGFNTTVWSVAVQADGKVVAVGDFTTYQGTTAVRLIRLNADGSPDTGFATGTGFTGTNSGPNTLVRSVVVQADGKVLVGGTFTSYNGTTGQNDLVRLNADGSRDATFNIGAGFDGHVATIAVQADGKVLVGGNFGGYQGTAAGRLVRLNADGSRDAGFDIGTGITGSTNIVTNIAVQADGKVLVGGQFSGYNGTTAGNLVRLNADGSLDAGFAIGTGFSSFVSSIVVQADGKVLVGGDFTSYNGTPGFNRVARLNADGSRDAGFDIGTGFDGIVRSVAVLADGRALVGGHFMSYNGTTDVGRLVCLNTDGSRNTAPTAVPRATFTFSPSNTTTNPLVTSTAGNYTATASLNGETSAASNTVVLSACPVPTIGSLSPTSGPVGTAVTITGTNFTAGSTVSFNGTAATAVTFTSGTSLTATVPTGATTGNVTVTTAAGTSNGVAFTVTAAPSLTTAAPATIGSQSAQLGGNVTSDNGDAVTERGVVYVPGTGTPTTSNTKVVIGSGTGAFSQNVAGLAASTQYTVRAFATNGVGTSYGANATFTTSAPLGGTTVVTNVSCFGSSTGAIDLTPGGGLAPYTFVWNDNTQTEDRTGLAAGTYSVTITDATGATATVSATVTQPAAVGGTTVVTNVLCNGGNTGAINLTPTGGTAPYTFVWNDATTSEDRTNRPAGTYSVTITDANGCTGTASAAITQPSPLVLTAAAQTNVRCFGGSTGAASVNPATGGTPGYTYDWTPGNPTGDGTTSVTNLAAGTYTLTVTDANNCTATQSFTITQPASALALGGTQTNVTVSGGSDGTATVTATGGTSAYTYDWTPGTPAGDGTATVTGLMAGTYAVLVTDANGCTASRSFTITQPATAAPTVTAPANGSLTNDNTPTYSGTGPAGSTITVLVDGMSSGTTTATGGTWSLTPATALADGAHTVSATATAGTTTSGPSNVNTFTVDATAPTVVVSSTAGSNGTTTSTTPLPFAVTFSEAVLNFVSGDVTVTGGTLSGFTGSGATYTLSVTPTGNGPVTVRVSVAANVAQDAAGNGNAAAPAFALSYQASRVTSITRLTPTPTATATVSYRVTFAVSVTGVSASNFALTTTGAVSGASVGAVSGSGTSYTVEVNTGTGTGNGTLRLDVDNTTGIAPALTNVPFTGGEVYTITKSFAAAPTLRLQGAGSTTGRNDVTAFVDVVQVLSGGSPFAGGLQNGSFETNNVAAGSVLYAPGTFGAPTGAVAAPWSLAPFSGVSRNGSAFGSTAAAGNAVALLQSYLGTNSNVSQNLAVPTGLYQASFQVAQRTNQASDQVVQAFVNNVFVGSIQPANGTYQTFTSAEFSVTAPALTATITSTAPDPTTTTPIPVTVTFSQAVTGFVATDVVATNGTVSGFSGSGTTYIFNVAPTAAGLVTVDVPAAVALDANNTGNAAATPLTRTYNLPDLLISTTGPGGSPIAIAAGSYNNVTITGSGFGQLAGAVTVNGAFLVQGSLSTNCQALTGTGSFTLAAGATLLVCDANGLTASGSTGAVHVSGTRSYSSDASYAYNGTQAQATGAGLPATVRNLTIANPADVTLTAPVTIAQTLTMAAAGNLALNGQPLTLLSDATGTALAVNSGAGIVTGGTATVQRYLTTTNPGLGYRHYSSPVRGNTMSDLATASFTPVFSATYNTATTAPPAAGFPTVLGYDQGRMNTTAYQGFDRGWFSPAATATMGAATGYAVNLRGTEVVDFTGTLRTGDYARALPRAAGIVGGEGLHLVGNPYPAPIDWSLVTTADRPGVDAAFYVFESSSQYGGAYRSAVNGIGSSAFIGSSQGFFVRVTPGQTSGTLTFKNAHRLTDYAQQVAVRRGAADTRPLVQLALAGSGATDNLYVYAEAGATPGVDAQYDAAKLANPSGLNLAALTATGEALAIDGLPVFATAQRIPLQLAVPANGPYTLTAATLANLPATTAVTLTDALAGTTTDLRRVSSYRFTAVAAAPATGRFFLNLTPAGTALAANAAVLAAQAQVYPNPAHDAFTLLLPPVVGATQATATLVNALGQVVHTQTLALTAGGATARYTTAGLAAGVYALRLSAGKETATLRVVLE